VYPQVIESECQHAEIVTPWHIDEDPMTHAVLINPDISVKRYFKPYLYQDLLSYARTDRRTDGRTLQI